MIKLNIKNSNDYDSHYKDDKNNIAKVRCTKLNSNESDNLQVLISGVPANEKGKRIGDVASHIVMIKHETDVDVNNEIENGKQLIADRIHRSIKHALQLPALKDN